MKKILFLGNCQPGALDQILKFNKSEYSQSYFPVHTKIDPLVIQTYIEESDIIITQQIFDCNGGAATENVVKLKKPECKLIIFPSCYMKLYYFDMTYYLINETVLNKPHDYHYNSIMYSYKNNLNIKNCIEMFIENINFKNIDELYNIYHQDIEELNIRKIKIQEIIKDVPNTYLIDILDFIKQNYKQKLLFYSINHPSYVLLEYIIKKIIDMLNIDSNLIRIEKKDPLDESKGILYSSLNKILEFDINLYKPKLHNIYDTKNIVQKYYDTYHTIDLK